MTEIFELIKNEIDKLNARQEDKYIISLQDNIINVYLKNRHIISNYCRMAIGFNNTVEIYYYNMQTFSFNKESHIYNIRELVDDLPGLMGYR
jgi:hypothetical protein